jgi:hypothetical protein
MLMSTVWSGTGAGTDWIGAVRSNREIDRSVMDFPLQ